MVHIRTQVSDEEDIVRLKKVVATREAKIRGQGPDQLLGTAAFELSSRCVRLAYCRCVSGL